MADAVLLILVVFVAFLATNLDNLALLIGLSVRYPDRRDHVAIGYLAAMLVVGGIAAAIGKAADAVPVHYLGLLGIVPVAIGLKGLFELFKGAESPGKSRANGDGSVIALTLATQLGNGTDTVLTFSVLVADANDKADILIGAAFACMVAMFAISANVVTRHASLLHQVEHYSRRVMPFVLIAVGLFVLSNTGMDQAPGP